MSIYKLLIVDDEPIVRKGIRSFVDFEALSIDHVFEASNGSEALTIFKKELPHMVLADINMPKMNGLDFAALAKEVKPDVKIAVITGYDYFDYAVKALKTGIDDYILKPVSRKDIFELLQKLVDKLREEKVTSEINHVVKDLKDQSGIDEQDTYQSRLYNLVEENIGNKGLTLSLLAEEMGLSVGYLSGLFKKLFGQSFKEYVLARRLERAKILLLSSDMKNYEITDVIGFDDPNYFSTCFKKKYGVAPSKYKEKIRND
ncbi:response regulator transcription factor [Vallitalea pronyensis]|uniref:response regulator transcription factor n=1 Tax=Vallitalea pronyensis TaxID=1348613 RepID=UPI001FEBB52E|nr:response regulator [Vallitalea pronyensis]